MPRMSCGRCARVLDYSGDRPSFCAYCGQPLIEPLSSETVEHVPAGVAETVDLGSTPDLALGSTWPERVGGYRLIREIGKGGMGTVFEAEDLRHGRRVALKLIAPGYVASAAAVERFRREGRLASTLAHPRCVFVLEADEDDEGRPFIAMELMTGATLQDLVERDGPMPVGEAVARLLDVIEGLTEAHRLGLIHRDVKPSNCFLDGDGRVKIGDFGLSKTQVDASNLTRTGAFLGTPLYASPEQIRVETLDARTDVYSAAATLFYLLTARAPFDWGDASATMARIVSDPAPSARERRPEVSPGLDRAIRKGLERDRDRRHADLEEFRAALLPWLPGRAIDASPKGRVAAYLVDYALVQAVLSAAFWEVTSPVAVLIASSLVLLAYFTIGDGVFGASPGKRLFKFRVADADGRDAAGVRRSAIRAAVFLTIGELPFEAAALVGPGWLSSPWSLAGLGLAVLGLVILAWPMRRATAFRGMHDLAGATRVVALPRDSRRRGGGSRRPIGRDRGSVSRPVGVMQSIGPYRVRGAVRWEPGRRVVSGEDSSLGREAWIVLGPRGGEPPPVGRRDVTRATRPRWLAGGEQAEGRWDAYVAPAGCPLADLAGAEGLPWRDARPILEDLADELTAASAEGTLPPGLTVDQVWVQPDGRAILVDPLAIDDGQPDDDRKEPTRDDRRALSLLRRAAALALEGGRTHADEAPTAIRAVVPLHALKIVDRLVGGVVSYETIAQCRHDFEATRHLPTEVTTEHRARQLGLLALFVSIGLLYSFGLLYLTLSSWPPAGAGEGSDLVASHGSIVAAWLLLPFPALWIGVNLATMGGCSFRLTDLGLMTPDGRPAPRWRCGLRTALVWLAPSALLYASILLRARFPESSGLSWAAYIAAAVVLALQAIGVLLYPSKGIHDSLSGLRVVPR